MITKIKKNLTALVLAGAIAFAPVLLFGASLNAIVSAIIYITLRGKLPV